MKFAWTIALLLVLGALYVFLQADAPTRMNASARSQEDALLANAAAAIDDPPKTTAPSPTPAANALSTELGAASAARAMPSPTPSDDTATIAEQARTPLTTLVVGAPTAITEGKMRVIPSKFESLADGTIVADDVWRITGKGTIDDPYCVSWEFLASAADTYTPRVQDFGFPERILLLHGKQLRIAGYLAFPLVAPTSSECLVMLNQWDGCCIGVPPTPYDAVEVQLHSAIPRSQRHAMAYGSVEGRFEVEPYIVESWLVGLYMLKDSLVDQGL